MNAKTNVCFPSAIFFIVVPLGGNAFNFIILCEICMIFCTLVTANVDTNPPGLYGCVLRRVCRCRKTRDEYKEKGKKKKREMSPEPFYVCHFSRLIIFARRHQMETVRMNKRIASTHSVRRGTCRHVGMPNARFTHYVICVAPMPSKLCETHE